MKNLATIFAVVLVVAGFGPAMAASITTTSITIGGKPSPEKQKRLDLAQNIVTKYNLVSKIKKLQQDESWEEFSTRVKPKFVAKLTDEENNCSIKWTYQLMHSKDFEKSSNSKKVQASINSRINEIARDELAANFSAKDLETIDLNNKSPEFLDSEIGKKYSQIIGQDILKTIPIEFSLADIFDYESSSKNEKKLEKLQNEFIEKNSQCENVFDGEGY